MCELFGINSKRKVEINSYLKTFYSHSEKHYSGWGLACIYGESVSLEKEAIKAGSSFYLHQRLAHPIIIDNAIAHIRLATVGLMCYENCHPFVKHDNMNRCWTLAHNGTIFDYPRLDYYKSLQEGDTDSERILYFILDNINELQKTLGRKATFEERFELIDNLLLTLSHNNKINLLIWDGEFLYVHYNYSDTMFVKNIDGGKIFCTQPLEEDGSWQKEEFLRLRAYQQGTLIARGKNITEEYTAPVRDWEYQDYDYSFL